MTAELDERPQQATSPAAGGEAERRELGRAALINGILLVAALYFLVPIYWVIVAASKSTEDLFGTHGFWFAGEFELFDNIAQVFAYDGGVFLRWFANSALYSVVGGAVATYLAAAGGYALAKYAFRGREVIFGVLLGGVLVPMTATALPLFLLFSQLGLTDTYWGVLIPSMVSPFGIFLCRIYAAASVSDAVIEAARIDGAGELRIFHAVGLRAMTPALVTVFLFQLVSIWNNYFLPLVMLSDPSLYPITLGLNNWRGQVDRLPEFYELTTGGVLVSIVPLAVAVVVLQRFWRSGLTDGAVK
ncbi:carbohydrate ABC transporter permease [Saccharopolyspora griseoalba]|uniref:Carbohydrate ABC transporter permease n=1 Tax=Saccharopolyspora griseoalba TaxID=1431848 RepID=A0ABW2LQC2_9PSEU